MEALHIILSLLALKEFSKQGETNESDPQFAKF
jgi:hypothetical protein